MNVKTPSRLLEGSGKITQKHTEVNKLNRLNRLIRILLRILIIYGLVIILILFNFWAGTIAGDIFVYIGFAFFGLVVGLMLARKIVWKDLQNASKTSSGTTT